VPIECSAFGDDLVGERFRAVIARDEFLLVNIEDASFRECRAEAASYSFTDTYCWGDSMSKRNQVIFEEGGLEAMARLQEQDEEFCRRLRIRVRLSGETGP
jgi:hypothetical protein